MQFKWSDNNRFNQSISNEETIFPIQDNYSNLFLYEEDLHKAEERELIISHSWYPELFECMNI